MSWPAARSVEKINWCCDYICSAAVTLSGEGSYWPTSAGYITPLFLTGHLSNHHWNVCVDECWDSSHTLQDKWSVLGYLSASWCPSNSLADGVPWPLPGDSGLNFPSGHLDVNCAEQFQLTSDSGIVSLEMLICVVGDQCSGCRMPSSSGESSKRLAF